jgi:hypothetical protein
VSIPGGEVDPVTPLLRSLSRLGSPFPEAMALAVLAKPVASAPAVIGSSEDEENNPDRLAEVGVVPIVRVPPTLGLVPDAVSVKVKVAVPELPGSAVSAPVPPEDEENDPDRLAEVGVVPIVRVPPTLGLVPDAVSVVVRLAVPESRLCVALPGAAASVSVAFGVSVVVSAVVLSVPAVAQSVPWSIMMPMPLPEVVSVAATSPGIAAAESGIERHLIWRVAWPVQKGVTCPAPASAEHVLLAEWEGVNRKLQ